MAIVTYSSPAQSHSRQTYDLFMQIREKGLFLDWVQEDADTGEVLAYKVNGRPVTILKRAPGVADPVLIASAQRDFDEASRVPHTIRAGQSAGDILAEKNGYPVQGQPVQALPSRGMMYYIAALAAAAFLL